MDTTSIPATRSNHTIPGNVPTEADRARQNIQYGNLPTTLEKKLVTGHVEVPLFANVSYRPNQHLCVENYGILFFTEHHSESNIETPSALFESPHNLRVPKLQCPQITRSG